MNMSEFIRWTTLLKSLGYSSDEILKMLEYVESGNETILKEILEKEKEKEN